MTTQYRPIHKLTPNLTEAQTNKDTVYVALEALQGDCAELSYNGSGDFKSVGGKHSGSLISKLEKYYLEAGLPEGATITLFTNTVKKAEYVVDIKYTYPRDKAGKVKSQFLSWATIKFYARKFGFKLPKELNTGKLIDIFDPTPDCFYHPVGGESDAFYKYRCVKTDLGISNEERDAILLKQSGEDG